MYYQWHGVEQTQLTTICLGLAWLHLMVWVENGCKLSKLQIIVCILQVIATIALGYVWFNIR